MVCLEAASMKGRAMKSQYINELCEGSRVDTELVMSSKELRSTRAGEAYLQFRFSDRSGRIDGVWFKPALDASDTPAGSVVRVSGTVTAYRGQKRISVRALRPAETASVEDMLPRSPRARDELIAAFTEHVRAVKDPTLRKLLRVVFGQKEFFERFCECPGAKVYHHAYLGGLLEHTVSVASLARCTTAAYADADADLLLAAALLHDIGKVDELLYDTAIDYSDSGRLLGHVTLGMQRVHRAATDLKVGAAQMQRLTRLEHAILSHHGELEWGSPKQPSTLEALLLHHIDNLDAKAAGFSAALSGAASVNEVWTDADNLFRRPLYAPSPADRDRAYRVEEDGQYFARTA